MKIAGFRKFTSKSGTDCCIVTALSYYTDREKEYGGVGQKAEDFFIPKDYHAMIDEKAIGKTIAVSYAPGKDGKAYVSGVVIE